MSFVSVERVIMGIDVEDFLVTCSCSNKFFWNHLNKKRNSVKCNVCRDYVFRDELDNYFKQVKKK